MLTFCPTCANILIVEESSSTVRLACSTCPYVHNIKQKVCVCSIVLLVCIYDDMIMNE